VNRAPLSLRQFVLVSVATAAGTSAASTADALISNPGLAGPLAGPLAGGLTALWVVDKLHKLIDDRQH
jgi:hypothetical protein